MLSIEINYDVDTPNPCKYSGWKLYSFSHRHNNFEHPSKFFSYVNALGNVVPKNIGIDRKLKCNTAFVLSCFQHGPGCTHWSLKNEGHQCPWDTAQIAGMLMWEDDPKNLSKVKETRKKIARSFLELYSDWCNGECYYYIIENDGETIDSREGFIGSEHILAHLKDEHPEVFKEKIAVSGEAGYILD